MLEQNLPLRVMSLHALLYCERLFYLEEVEEIRRADAAVYAGRRLHEQLAGDPDDDSPEIRSFEVASETWGLLGKVDGVRKRDGRWIVREHKRGRCRRGPNKEPLAWPSDRIQTVAYAVLLEETLGEPVREGRIRYHRDNVTATIEIDNAAHEELRAAISRARELRNSVQRPPVTENEKLCIRCSLAPVCLPEEERLASVDSPARTPRLFPSLKDRQTLHLASPRGRIARSGESLMVTTEENSQKVPIEQLDTVVIHGHGQITTQAVHLCVQRGVAVQWLSGGGRFISGTTASPGRVQQRIRQYAALADSETCLRLARQLVHAKVESQLRYLMRATRGNATARDACTRSINGMKKSLADIPAAADPATLRGLEGIAAKEYFASLPHLIAPSISQELHPGGRSKHPPRDRFNCLLSFAYALVQSLVHRSIEAVGLEPSFGFFHRPRTSAHPLVLDLMELFRTALGEIPVIGSINRGQWNLADDFELRSGAQGAHVWLSDSGRKKLIKIFEQRLTESYKHPNTGQSLAYARLVELEVRLLEKEWSGCEGVFAQMRLR